MTRQVYVFDKNRGKCVPISERTDRPQALHAVIQDTMDPTWHPHDNKIYNSKSAFRAVTKAAGLEEFGNEFHTASPQHRETDNREGRITEIKKQIEIYESRHGRIG